MAGPTQLHDNDRREAPRKDRQTFSPSTVTDLVQTKHTFLSSLQYARHHDKDLPIFSRDILLEIAKQIHEPIKGSIIKIPNIFGDKDEWKLVRHDDNQGDFVLGLQYTHYQDLVYRSRSRSLTDNTPGDFYPWKLCLFDITSAEPTHALITAISKYENHRSAWLNSETCKAVQKYLASVDTMPTITKIVCIGNGDLSDGPLGGPLDLPRSLQHACEQHCAAETIATAIEQRVGDGKKIPLFAQDPEYTATTKAFLATRGFTILDDPFALLKTDSETLVIGVRADIPVRQIVADIMWPAAFLFDTIKTTTEAQMENDQYIFSKYLGEENRQEWAPEHINGEVYYQGYHEWHDPPSKRVREMAWHYKAWKMPESAAFLDCTLYLNVPDGRFIPVRSTTTAPTLRRLKPSSNQR